MTKRKSISKKDRFEVFKRDSFTCQYCGAKAPDVVLEVDHIKPVALGGDNSVMNLVTSCAPCNSGKGAREISDGSVVSRQRTQLQELEERRQQIAMMLEWRDGLKEIEAEHSEHIENHIIAETGLSPNDHGRRRLDALIRKYPLIEILESIDTCIEQYCEWDSDDNVRPESWELMFSKIEPVIKGKRKYSADDRRIFYIRGIVRSRFDRNVSDDVRIIRLTYQSGVDLDDIENWAKSARSWSQLRNWCEEEWEAE